MVRFQSVISIHLAVLLAQLITVLLIHRGCGSPITSTLNSDFTLRADLRLGGSVKDVVLQSSTTKLNILTSQKNEIRASNPILTRHKRSPYPPGFVIWSAPSEPLPCHCSPGGRKCRCLRLLERLSFGTGKIPVIFRKRKTPVKY